MKSNLFSESRIKSRREGDVRRWIAAFLAVSLAAAVAAALPGPAAMNSRVLAAAAPQRVISTGTPTSGNAGRSTQGTASSRTGVSQGTAGGSLSGQSTAGQSNAAAAGSPSAAELERLQGFASTLEQQGISSTPQRRTGGYVSTGTPTFTGTQGTGTAGSSGPSVIQGSSDPRLEDMSSALQSWEAEHGPAVQDVVIQTRRPWQEADSEYQAYDPTGNLQYLPLDETVLSAEWESAGLLQSIPANSTQGAVPDTGGFTGGRNLFPTTDWRQFGTELVSLGIFTLTAYDPCLACCGKTDGITATGSKGMAGRTIAVDPEVIPYGSLVVVGGYVFIAEDAGEAIKGNHIDLFMDTHEVAKQFGVREAEVWLIR